MLKSVRIERRLKYAGPLQDLLLRACPPAEDGTVSIHLLARAIDVKPNTLHRSIRSGRISRNVATRLLALPGERITRDDLLPFLLGTE